MRPIDADFVSYAAECEFPEEDASKVRWLISHIPTIDVEQTPKWISVEERLPDDGIDVIVYTDRCGGNVEYAYYRYDRCAWFKNCILLIYNVTHWMPLPSMPKEDT